MVSMLASVVSDSIWVDNTRTFVQTCGHAGGRAVSRCAHVRNTSPRVLFKASVNHECRKAKSVCKMFFQIHKITYSIPELRLIP